MCGCRALCGGRHRDTDRVCTQTKGSFFISVYARGAGCVLCARARALQNTLESRDTHTVFIYVLFEKIEKTGWFQGH